jgi:hypothetical protein
MIVALTRKLLIALWRFFVTRGVIPQGLSYALRHNGLQSRCKHGFGVRPRYRHELPMTIRRWR